MVALARRMVFDAEYAREIAQEAFLRVWVNAKRWDPDGAATFATWLRRVVINLAISHRRRRHDQVGLDAIEELASGEANGFDHVAADDQKRLMQKALQKLPARQRAAIALNYFEDLPRMEAAQAMQMNLKAFDSLLVRARASLKKQIVALGLCGREDL